LYVMWEKHPISFSCIWVSKFSSTTWYVLCKSIDSKCVALLLGSWSLSIDWCFCFYTKTMLFCLQ
jgi:hypothetical protein